MDASPKNTTASRRKSVNPCTQISNTLFGFFGNQVLPLFFQKKKVAEVPSPKALPLCSETTEVKEEGEEGDWEEVESPGMSPS